MFKFALVFGNDTTLHGVHADTVALSPSVWSSVVSGLLISHRGAPRIKGSMKRSTTDGDVLSSW